MLALLSLSAVVSPASAGALAVPVRATYVEYTGWGESPAVVDAVASADVRISNPSTGKTFPVDGELLVTERTGAGTGELRFDDDASGTLHTWAIWALDANGELLHDQPEIVDVLFGDDEDGTIVARAEGVSFVKTLRVKNRTAPGVAPEDGTHTVQLAARDGGLRAAYFGIQELASDGTPLATHVDMEAMTAGVYATFQEKTFDALVPLDTWTAVVQGTVDVDALAISADGLVEGAQALDWDLTFLAAQTGEKPALDPSYVVGTQSYSLALRKLKGKAEKGFEARTVALDPADAVYDLYDASLQVTITSPGADLELGATLGPTGSGPKPVTDMLLALDPTERGATYEMVDTMEYPAADEYETFTVTFDVVDAGGVPTGEQDICLLTPTAKSTVEGGKALRWNGECMREDDGTSTMGPVSMKLTNDGALTVAFERTFVGGKDGGTPPEIDVETKSNGPRPRPRGIRKRARVLWTWEGFVQPWTFPTDPRDAEYALHVYVYGADVAPDIDLAGTGWYDWTFADPTWTFGKDETGPYAHGVTTGTASRIARTP